MAVVSLVQEPLARATARHVSERRFGLAQALPAPAWARDATAFLLLDYSIYLWHVITHRNALLWRLHLVHHVEHSMSLSTALRFLALDMLVSMPWRLGQIVVAGSSERAHRVWQAWFFASVLFHHSNLRLPWAVERRLMHVMATPRLHDIHHGRAAVDLDRNFASGLTIWDRLHGTWHADARDGDAPIGVPGEPDGAAQTVGETLALPFRARSSNG